MKRVLYIIMLIAFVGGVIAPACGFAWGGKYSIIEICTSQGIEMKIVPQDGQSNDMPAMSDQCQFCFASANITASIVSERQIEKIAYQAERIKFQRYAIIVLSRGIDDTSPRGPPALV